MLRFFAKKAFAQNLAVKGSAYLYPASKVHYASVKKNFVDFSPEIEKEIMNLVPNAIIKPTLRPTKKREEYSDKYDRTKHCGGCSKCGDWSRDLEVMTEQDAIREAQRCLKCTDAPCQKGCSTSIDIKTFIYNIQNRNWYGAAKTILSDNPLGLSCGMLCPISELCARNCNVSHTELGAIKINRLQEFAVRVFKEMGVPQIRDPSLPKNLPESYQTKIAIIGAGSAGISAATFLGRMGYDNVHIFEKSNYGGGLVSSEIPENRAPYNESKWEVELVKQLGVQIHYGKALGKDFTIEDLRNQGYETVFLGTGLSEPNKALGEIYDAPNVFNSKTFLPVVCHSTKEGIVPEKVEPPKLHGHAVVLGIGDTALDCARSAFRCGAQRVTVVFRRGWSDFRANDEIFDPSRFEGINFVPYSNPKQLVRNDKGDVIGIEFEHNLPKNNDPDNLNYVSTGDKMVIPCDFVITAFGSQLPTNEEWVVKLANKKGIIDVDYHSNRTTKFPWLFAGGDAIGAKNLVDAVNDGKTASWFMHKYIQEKAGHKVPEEPKLPGFYTPIDLVNLETEVCGVKFPNPLGLASAPPTTSYPMIKRAFEVGWGFAVVKTFVLDKDTISNVSPRIFKSTTDPLKHDAGYANIELISEKSAAYWIEGAKQLKKEFPNHVVIGSLMAGFNKEDWTELTEMANTAPFDLIELNLSCPHGMTDLGMGRACGENPEMVKQISQWVSAVSKVPVIVKITPNYGYSDELARAAKEGGAAAVCMTNTMPSLMDPNPEGIPWPAVGEKKQVAFGGATGSALRPFALKKASEVAKNVPGIEIFGSGGIITGDHAMSYIRYGSKALQICSSVQDQDASTVAFDLTTSLQAHMYLSQREDLRKKGWSGQSPPMKFDQLKTISPVFGEVKTPTIKDFVGVNLKHLADVTDMDRSIFLIPEIDESKCLQCGRCYLTCADSGYQAIKFGGFDEFPVATNDCTGCALCHAVCPVPGALNLVPRTTPYTVNRGITPKGVDPEHLRTVMPVKDAKAPKSTVQHN